MRLAPVARRLSVSRLLLTIVGLWLLVIALLLSIA